MKCLLTDDNRDLADGLCILLEDIGHETKAAYSGQEALALVERENFDIIFLDAKLPDHSGLELHRIFRRLNRNAEIILMTGFRLEQLLSFAAEPGHARVVQGPVSPEDLDYNQDQSKQTEIILAVNNSVEDLTERLASLGKTWFVLKTEEDVQHALNEDDSPQYYISEIQPPLLRSLDAFLELKANGKNRPMIITLNMGDGNKNEPLRNLEATGCLFKPFPPEKMAEVVDSIQEGRCKL